MMNLIDLGWNNFFESHLNKYKNKNFIPARVVRQDKTQYILLNEQGSFSSMVTGKFRFKVLKKSDYPAVGDWVGNKYSEEDNQIKIHVVLPRKSSFSRNAAGQETEEQILAANIDIVFLVSGLDNNFNLRRIECYLTLAWDSGAKPVVVLNKVDLCDNPDEYINEVEKIALGVPVVSMSARDKTGMDEILSYIKKGKTCVLLGSSGVGKSTIINSLLGEDRQEVNEVRESDSRGRHTTTRRELILLPSGGMLIDTPGLREIQLWSNEDSLSRSFEDIESLAQKCRFGDCKHENEPGCAVQQALEDGVLSSSRFKSYLKQAREISFLARQQGDKEEYFKNRTKWKQITKLQRSIKKNKEIY